MGASGTCQSVLPLQLNLPYSIEESENAGFQFQSYLASYENMS
jgi:hypothetical protein